MQIGSGQAPLSLAMLKAFGTQLTAPQSAPAAANSGAANSVAGKPAIGPAAAAKASAAEVGDSLATARTLPRGSFVDLRV
jgi:hypothetical protein